MRFIKYTLLLLIIAITQMLMDWPLAYIPEFIYIIAFISSLNTTVKNTLIAFFIAGFITDLFIRHHLGVNTLLFTSSSIFIIYLKIILQSKNGFLQLLILGISLIFILTLRFLLIDINSSFKSYLMILFNNFLFSILISPAIGLILKVPIICPWKKDNS